MELRHLQWVSLDDLGNNISNGVDCCLGCGAGRSQPHDEDCELICTDDKHEWIRSNTKGIEFCWSCKAHRENHG